jgi:hypothetical protein
MVVAAVAVGTFVLSYSGVHAIALQSGVSASLARYYPAVFDAVLVIACAAAPLPGARWWTRLYTWLVILVVMGLLGAMDAVHAMNVALPRRQVAGVVAVLPWGLLLLALSLWLAILRHFRVQQPRLAGPAIPLAEDAGATGGPEGTEGSDDFVGSGVIVARAGVRPALPAPSAAADVAAAEEVAAAEVAASHAPEPEPEEELIPGLAAEASGVPEASGSEAALDGDPWAAARLAAEDHDTAPDEVPGTGGEAYAAGPMLRRIRSLPATPVDDDN